MEPKEATEKPQAAQSDPPEKTEPTRSAEEQMAEFEEALKESDWGHQPC